MTRHRIGVDLGGTKIEAIALDENGNTIFRKRTTTPQGDYAATIEAVVRLVHEAGDGSVGIGIPGALSRVSGLVKNANSTWLIGRPPMSFIVKYWRPSWAPTSCTGTMCG